ncbi:hypothetical protein [Alteromonas gracilis]|uniref:hypothetical protein n=1 Tax=Alteromonas gracilis TaxID=1479524 RepID=UPI0037352B14
MTKPNNVKVAIFLYFTSLALGIAGAIPNYSAAEPKPPFISVLIVWGVTFGLLGCVGYLIALRKNWARHLNAVITLISVGSVLYSGVSPSLVTNMSQLILLLNSVISIIVLILLYTASSNAWFKQAHA